MAGCHRFEDTHEQRDSARGKFDWSNLDACLDFHQTKPAVRTVSATQVREKMYTGSSEAWRRYKPFLGPMLERSGSVV